MPLSAYCRDAPCPDYDSFVAGLRTEAQRLIAGNGLGGTSCQRGYIGRCGALRVASLFNGLYGPSGFFREDESLLGVRYQTDTGPCFELTYGEPPTCEPVIEEDLCMK